MNPVTAECEERMNKTIAALKDALGALRTGRASPALFDKIRVEQYGAKVPLNQVATLSIPEARLVVINPFDKNSIGEIEKAIRISELSLNPSNDGKVIRIQIPPLTEDRRKDLAKQARTQAEQARVAVRNIRRDGNEELKKLQKDSKLTEDEEKQATKALQDLTDALIKKIGDIATEKENEILKV
ncbi:ribosome-recycling factor [Spirochaetia bacterium]|nr:ribosome-recycling factor [Spirochaetia bacterium]GHU35105.1 ribosome-recycling factor [Spirochaetia bacterium]